MSEKIRQLPNTKMSPETLLYQILEQKDQIKSVMIITFWDDDTMTCNWSNQNISITCMMEAVVSRNVQQLLDSSANGLADEIELLPNG